MNEILTKEFSEESVWDKLQFWGAYNAHSTFNLAEQEKFNTDYDFNYINIGLDGKLKNNNADFRIMLNYSPTSTRAFAQNLFADMYVATNKIPHHRFQTSCPLQFFLPYNSLKDGRWWSFCWLHKARRPLYA